jgi:hypothetical protein
MKKAIILVFCILEMLPAFAQDGLLAHYTFDGTASDITGNGNDGVVQGATPCEDRFGNTDGAYRFASLSDRILIDQTAFDINDYDEVTVSFWFKRSLFDYDGYNPHMIFFGNFSNYTICLDAEFAYGLPSPQYKDRFIFYNYSTSGSFDIQHHTTPVTDTEWHFFAAVIKKNPSKIEFFVDGESSGELSYLHNYIAYPYLTIGNHYDIDWAFIGDMDDVRIYNHALTADEINATLSTESAKLTQLTLFPNPCDEQISIKTDALEVNYLDLYNIYGELVRTTPLTVTTTVSVADLPSGVYIASFRKDSKHVHAEKVIIAHDIRTP